MENIPNLKPTNINYKTSFLDKKFLNECDDIVFEKLISNYPNRILDIFEKCLNNNSKEIDLLESEYFRLSNENKYLNFIKDVFIQNNNRCIVNIDFNLNNYDLLLNFANKLDKIDKYIILNQFKKNKQNNSTYFIIDDINLLLMFTKGILRELFNVELYFEEKPLLIFSNFDLSIPIIFKNEGDMIFYEKIALKNKLYFR